MTGHKTLEGQLTPLRSRMSQHRLDKRDERANFRSNLAKAHAMTRGGTNACLNVLQRGFWGRLKWLVMGR